MAIKTVVVGRGGSIPVKGGLIKSELKARGLNYEQAAEDMDIPEKTLAHIIQRGTCNAINLGKIAKFLGLPIWELVA